MQNALVTKSDVVTYNVIKKSYAIQLKNFSEIHKLNGIICITLSNRTAPSVTIREGQLFRFLGGGRAFCIAVPITPLPSQPLERTASRDLSIQVCHAGTPSFFLSIGSLLTWMTDFAAPPNHMLHFILYLLNCFFKPPLLAALVDSSQDRKDILWYVCTL